MKPMPKLLTRLVAACVALTSVFPAHAAPLALKQLPQASVVPPPPNIVVTLDDSGSMGAVVPFVLSPTQEYPVPPGPTGTPLQAETSPPYAYVNGYAGGVLVPIDVSGAADYPDGASDTEADRQKFVNWYGFYRTRNMAMKAAVMSAFSPTLIPDDQVRLAWQALNGTCAGGFPSSAASCPTPNTMWTLSDSGGRTHRTNFFNWVRSVPFSGGTPLRRAYTRAGEYFRTTGINSPWAFKPGTTRFPERSCRRSYQIMFTDGGHNESNLASFGNADNTNITLPDGVAYVGSGASRNRPYAGRPDSGGSLTLADVAFTYWATDLQTGASFGNDLEPLIKKPGPELYGGVNLPEYWNPKNNPASWQHLVTYGVALGEAAEITNPLWEGSTTAGAQFAGIVDGTREWPNTISSPIEQRAPDLWHAAVNSRGQMFPANDQKTLDQAFKSVIGGILGDGTATGGGVSSLSAVASSDFKIVQAGFTDNPTWRADIKGYGITPTGARKSPHDWDAQVVVGAQPADDRVVLTSVASRSAVPFRWSSLTVYEQTALNLAYTGFVDSLGADRVDFLRGSKDKEVMFDSYGVVIPGGVFRNRDGAVIGTVANSEPRIVQAPRSGYISTSYRSFRTANLSRTPIVYVGANDGMMHGIRTSDGQAVLSYVPRAVYPNLPFYTDPAYTHKMYVDGPLISSDFQDSADSNKWKTILVGGLGAGGKGLYALDVTKPADFAESSASSLVKFDYTAPGGALPSSFVTEAASVPMLAELQTDMGHVFGDPSRDSFIGRNLQITRMQNGKWAVISGNGVNSVNEKAVLYVIYLDGSGTFVKIPASLSTDTAKPGNGMAIPFPADINGDGLTDTVYAGDLLGRMWKFDLSSGNPTDWVDPSKTKLMIDTGRPITTASTLLIHPQGGVLVAFGTGRLLTDADSSSTAMEAIYGIWDKPSGSLPVTDANLAIRKLQVLDEKTASTPATVGVDARVLEGGKAAAVNYGTQRGWKIELLKTGERVVFNPIGDGTRVFFSTSTASTDICKASDGGSFLAFDGITGTEPSSPVLDINNDRTFGTGDSVPGRSTMGRSAPIGRLIAIVAPPPLAPGAAASTARCLDPANLAYGALGEMCVSKDPGLGRKLWRDLRP